MIVQNLILGFVANLKHFWHGNGSCGGFTPNSTFGNFSDAAMDLDFMDELFFEGCRLETSDGFNFM